MESMEERMAPMTPAMIRPTTPVPSGITSLTSSVKAVSGAMVRSGSRV